MANSTPIVALLSKLNSFLANLDSSYDFPTQVSPIKTILNKKSYSCAPSPLVVPPPFVGLMDFIPENISKII